MRKIQRVAALGAMAVLTVTLGACAGPDQAAAPSTSSAPSMSSSAMAPSSSAAMSSGMASGSGVTTPDDTFGAACSGLPAEGTPGSLTAMGPQPVGTAAGTNPLLTTLTEAVTAAGLGNTLNSAPALTVFAPTDEAFAAVQTALGDEAFNALLANQEGLGALLQYHVSGTRYDREGLVSAGTVTELMGGTVTVAESGDTLSVTDGMGNAATVLCGNIPTSNATVFVIDKVLMPAS